MYVHHPSNHEPAADQAKRAQENFTLSYARLLDLALTFVLWQNQCSSTTARFYSKHYGRLAADTATHRF